MSTEELFQAPAPLHTLLGVIVTRVVGHLILVLICVLQVQT